MVGKMAKSTTNSGVQPVLIKQWNGKRRVEAMCRVKRGPAVMENQKSIKTCRAAIRGFPPITRDGRKIVLWMIR